MANTRSHQDDKLSPIIKTSDTGHDEHPAKKAPMSAKKTVLLGGEQTSAGAAAEKRNDQRRSQPKVPPISIKEKKLKDASLKPLLPREER